MAKVLIGNIKGPKGDTGEQGIQGIQGNTGQPPPLPSSEVQKAQSWQRGCPP